jgi:hypothetical protein
MRWQTSSDRAPWVSKAFLVLDDKDTIATARLLCRGDIAAITEKKLFGKGLSDALFEGAPSDHLAALAVVTLLLRTFAFAHPSAAPEIDIILQEFAILEFAILLQEASRVGCSMSLVQLNLWKPIASAIQAKWKPFVELKSVAAPVLDATTLLGDNGPIVRQFLRTLRAQQQQQQQQRQQQQQQQRQQQQQHKVTIAEDRRRGGRDRERSNERDRSRGRERSSERD